MINLLEVVNIKLWLIDPAYAARVYPIISELIARGQFLTERLDGPGEHQKPSIRENVAVLPIHGMMTKNGNLSAHGTKDISSAIAFANKDPNINSIVLDIESSGGTVDGTADLAQAVRDSKKPIVSYVDSIAASAAFWVASQTDEIIVSGTNSPKVGSIGAMYLHTDSSKVLSKKVGDLKIIRAPQSVDKARVNALEPLTEDLEFGIREDLKAITAEFINTVKEGRGARLNTGEENIFTGKMYPGSEAVKMGMVDREGTFQDAVQSAYDLGKVVNEFETILN